MPIYTDLFTSLLDSLSLVHRTKVLPLLTHTSSMWQLANVQRTLTFYYSNSRDGVSGHTSEPHPSVYPHHQLFFSVMRLTYSSLPTS